MIAGCGEGLRCPVNIGTAQEEVNITVMSRGGIAKSADGESRAFHDGGSDLRIAQDFLDAEEFRDEGHGGKRLGPASFTQNLAKGGGKLIGRAGTDVGGEASGYAMGLRERGQRIEIEIGGPGCLQRVHGSKRAGLKQQGPFAREEISIKRKRFVQ